MPELDFQLAVYSSSKTFAGARVYEKAPLLTVARTLGTPYTEVTVSIDVQTQNIITSDNSVTLQNLPYITFLDAAYDLNGDLAIGYCGGNSAYISYGNPRTLLDLGKANQIFVFPGSYDPEDLKAIIFVVYVLGNTVKYRSSVDSFVEELIWGDIRDYEYISGMGLTDEGLVQMVLAGGEYSLGKTSSYPEGDPVLIDGEPIYIDNDILQMSI